MSNPIIASASILLFFIFLFSGQIYLIPLLFIALWVGDKFSKY